MPPEATLRAPEPVTLATPVNAPPVLTFRPLDVKPKVPVALPIVVFAVPVVLIVVVPVILAPPLVTVRPVPIVAPLVTLSVPMVPVPPIDALLVTLRAVPAALNVLARVKVLAWFS